MYAAAAASLPVMFDGPDGTGVSVLSGSGGIEELVPGALKILEENVQTELTSS